MINKSAVEISVAVITFNEEINIGNCLKSVDGVADDIVVVDSFSTDKTVEIAASFGARIVRNHFDGHIEQKNFAITQAKFPWILSLDADEMLDQTLHREILRVKSNVAADGYTMNRLNQYCGKFIRHGAWYPDTKLRLWDSRKGKWTGLNPHDRFELETGSRTEHLAGNILHYSYRSIGDHRKKVVYFSHLAAKAYHSSGRRARWWNLILNPASRFVRDYFLRLGFLDGRRGWYIAMLTAREVFLKYRELLSLRRGA